MPEEEKKGKGFVFVDKRKTHDAEEAGEGRADTSATDGVTEAPKDAPKAKSAEPRRTGGQDQPLETEADLPLAKQTIDIIALLQEKTRGNLAKDEEQFIEAVLYDLRMKYVEVNREKT